MLAVPVGAVAEARLLSRPIKRYAASTHAFMKHAFTLQGQQHYIEDFEPKTKTHQNQTSTKQQTTITTKYTAIAITIALVIGAHARAASGRRRADSGASAFLLLFSFEGLHTLGDNFQRDVRDFQLCGPVDADVDVDAFDLLHGARECRCRDRLPLSDHS